MILYQYRGNINNEVGVDYFIDLITKGSMRFSKPSQFNDPFDCCPARLSEIPTGALPHAIVDNVSHHMQKVTGKVVGVSCLTPHLRKMLMWSHYGDQHRSVCVGFDTETLLEKCPTNSEGNPAYKEIREVTYTKVRPNTSDTDVIYKKSEEWAYEDEYRIVSFAAQGHPQWGSGVWNIPMESIKEVVFGARVPMTLQEHLVSILMRYRPDISRKKAVLHSKKFEIVIEYLNKQPKVLPMSGYLLGENGNWIKT